MTTQLMQQVRLLNPVSETDLIADVLLVDGRVEAIADVISDYPDEAQVRDCRGLVLGAGLVDLYSHSGEPGFEERETLRSLSQAAAAGGFTRVTLLPDTHPPLDNPASIAWINAHSRNFTHQSETETPFPSPRLQCWGALTLDVKGQQMTELAELAEAGVVGFADGQPIASLALLRRVLEYARPLARPIALWCYDRSLAGNGVMREGNESVRFGLPGVPTLAETLPLGAVLECVEAIGTPVHLMRISTARSVELIQTAKQRGVPITASTTWQHLLLTSAAIASYDSSLHMEPPLGDRLDQAALLKGLQTGVLDAIAIDHTPYTYEEKTVAFAEAPPGAIGLELVLPLLWQALVETKTWSALDLWRSLSTRPAQCLQQTPPTVAVGQPAELTLFDPNQLWTVDTHNLKSLSGNTFWLGKQLTGRVVPL